jgi:glucose-6-phosphate 1-epimerase
VKLAAGVNGFPRFEVTTAQAEAHVYLYGAHVTHFQAVGERPLLFVSKDAVFQAGKAIRGGVPLIFPWFGGRASNPASPAHGFARTQTWTPESVVEKADGTVVITLRLEPTEASRAHAWADDWVLRHRITIGSTLTMEVEIENHGTAPIHSEDALHTYFAIDNVGSTEVYGLEGAEYLDKTDAMLRKRQGDTPVVFQGEVDRTYVNTTTDLVITGPGAGRRIVIEKTNSRSTVTWNPGSERVKTFADLGNDEWPQFACVETGNIADNTLEIAPGSTHITKTVIRTEPL